MASLDGTMWRLIESRGWDEAGVALPAPYGQSPMGQITFLNGRMLASLCNGDSGIPGTTRGFSSYGGTYVFDGETLEVSVDIASDPARIGGKQVRGVTMDGNRMTLRPPTRVYGASRQRRELVWECVWRS